MAAWSQNSIGKRLTDHRRPDGPEPLGTSRPRRLRLRRVGRTDRGAGRWFENGSNRPASRWRLDLLGSRRRPKGPTNPVQALFRTDSRPFVNEIGLSAWHRTARRLLHSRSAFGIGLPLTANVCRHLGCGCSSVVEHDLAKVGVEGSSPFARSRFLASRADSMMKARPSVRAF